MSENDWTTRISELQALRHRLLYYRELHGAPVESIDMQLSVVRSEIQAIYALLRTQMHTPPARMSDAGRAMSGGH